LEKAKKVTLSKLKPSSKTISIRLPEIVLEELKMLANKRDVPYQSLLKIFLAEKSEKSCARNPPLNQQNQEEKVVLSGLEKSRSID